MDENAIVEDQLRAITIRNEGANTAARIIHRLGHFLHRKSQSPRQWASYGVRNTWRISNAAAHTASWCGPSRSSNARTYAGRATDDHRAGRRRNGCVCHGVRNACEVGRGGFARESVSEGKDGGEGRDANGAWGRGHYQRRGEVCIVGRMKEEVDKLVQWESDHFHRSKLEPKQPFQSNRRL